MNAPLSPESADSLSQIYEIGGTDYVGGMERLVHAVQYLSLARTLDDIKRIVRTSAPSNTPRSRNLRWHSAKR